MHASSVRGRGSPLSTAETTPAGISHASLFLAALRPPLREQFEATPALEARLTQGLAACRAAWTTFSVEPDRFLPYLAERIDDGTLAEEALDPSRLEELYLACACAQGDSQAIASLEARFLTGLGPPLRRLALSDAAIEEATQALREQLFVAHGEERPLVASYSGRGSLGAWVRVIAIRTALKLLRRGQREIPVEEEVLQALPLPEEDPELGLLKRFYRSEFKEAFAEALASLPPRELVVLQQHYLDGLTTYQLGELYRVHQTTVARWLTKARDTLLAQTRETLMQRLRVGDEECESILRLITSHFEITLQFFLDR
ncbi:MAG: sigma-70 family RNA polymerase sigma factor [Deltaproteobacteria bacterium]|nr:sigma-70 family RNA polymerase sigma factor [Deltaproteobacteria bacterium]